MHPITEGSAFLYSFIVVLIYTTSLTAAVSASSSNGRNLVLAIDGGTESIRAACVDVETGHMVGKVHACPYATHHPHPGWAEQDPEEWWTALGTAIRGLVAELGDEESSKIRALSLDTTCCSVVALDAEQRPVKPCILWMDQRAAVEAAEIVAQGKADPALSVNNDGQGPVSAEWMLPKALWMQRYWPDLWRNQIKSICEYQDYLNLRLTGVLCASACNAATRWHWDGNTALDAATDDAEYPGRPLSLYKSLGIEELAQRLPRTVLPMGAKLGTLTDDAAKALRIPVGLPVIQGGPDAFVGMIGLGCVQPGKQLCLITGSSHLHCVVASTGTTAKGIWGAYPGAPLPGLFFAEGGQSSTGSILRWARRELFGDALSYAELDDEAAKIPPGAEGLIALETFQGSRTPVTDAKARGSMIGLTLSHTRAHVWRSFLEAVCYGTRSCVDALETAGHTCQEIVLAGGVTRSELWLQMHADVTNKVVTVCENSENAPLLGCAVLAAVGVGLYPTVEAACAAMIHTERTLKPNPAMAAKYDDVYANVYRNVAPAVQPISHAIHKLRGGASESTSGAQSILHRSSSFQPNERTITVSPSLLACDWGDMRKEVQRCIDAKLPRLHVDVFDGVFLDSPLALTFGPAMVQVVRKSAPSAAIIDLHVCVDRPGRYVEPMAQAGGSTFIFQWEAVPRLEDAKALASQVLQSGMECGVSLNPSTPISDIFQLLLTNKIAVVNLLAVEPGFGGQAYQYRVTEKIQQLVQWRKDQANARFKIMVDGGINGETARVAATAGADILVAGSFLFRSKDIASSSAKLMRR